MKPFTSAAQAFAHLARFTNYEKTPPKGRRTPYDLRRMRQLCAALGHPEEKFAAFHVTGTKGKGSTAHYLAAAYGKGAGLYTSPHLGSMLERIQVGGRPVSGKRFAAVMTRVVSKARTAPSEFATYFELMTAAAFEVFAGCGIAVIEVGLGGRLDATNVLPSPLACGITSIDWDHMDRLGNTLEKIAAEKAGIIKPGTVVVTAERKPGPLAVIRRAAKRSGAALLALGHDIHLRDTRADRRDRWSATLSMKGTPPLRVRLETPGRHQLDNFAVAWAMAQASAPLPAARWRAAAAIRLPGRLELIKGNPDVLLDVAHNPVSLRALAAHIARAFPKRRVALVFGTSSDKDIAANIETIAGAADELFFTKAAHPRATEPEVLRGLAGRGATFARPRQAFDAARQSAGKRGLVVIAGSFYLAGELLRAVRK
ncbi:MAG: bifunctional folylpolyglutamate synthase/dihydrofolate synthase [Planctomycetes bacterium]|nr:bifunctional folylpolyglutamate synthase/dihydrofolate synthase [Planctomycetota bacterium]